MADTEDEPSDSRTAAAGRKRHLQSTMQHRDPINYDDSSDEERSRKRVKETYFPSRRSSEMEVDERSAVEPEHLVSHKHSENETSKAKTSPTKSIPDPVQGESDLPRLQTEVQNNPLPIAWNRGVQSALRTSFGSKNRPQRIASSLGDAPENIHHVALRSATQFDTLMPLDSIKTQQNSNGIIHDGKSSMTKQSFQVQSVSTSPSQNVVLHSAKTSSKHEMKSCLENESREPTYAAITRTEIHSSSSTSCEDNNGNGENIRSKGITTLTSLPPTSHAVSPDQKRFKVLSKAALKRLPVPEREAYRKRLTAHQAEMNKDNVGQNTTEKALQGLTHGMTKKVTQGEIPSPNQQREGHPASAEAHRSKTRRKMLEEITREAANMLANGYASSVPAQRALRRRIEQGFTFYARKPSRNQAVYTNRYGQWNISEILDQGQPIHIDQMSFNVFAPAFIASNRDKWDVIDQKILHATFNFYLEKFYSHVPEFAEGPQASATAGDALTVEQAKQLVGPQTSNASTGSLAATGDDVGESSDPVVIPPPLVSTTEDSGYAEHSDTGHSDFGLTRSHVSPVSVEVSNKLGLESSVNEESCDSNLKQTTQTNVDTTVADEDLNVADANGFPPDALESMDLAMDESELVLQQKYFPSGIVSTARRCLSCGQVGHSSSACPLMSCSSCGSFGKHSTSSCPLNIRCGKCRAPGHPTEECPEKLGRSRSEAIPCDMCGSKDHVEIACHYIWRSFNPKLEEVRRVSGITSYCYECGGIDHYGPECGLHRGGILSGGNTWSRTNLQRYFDPSSQERALSAGIDYSLRAPSNKVFNIKGKGKANDPFPIDDSDDESFIRPKITPAIQHRPIRFGNPNEDYRPRGSYENSLPRGMQSASGNLSHYPAYPPHQNNTYRSSGLHHGSTSSMRGPNNGGGGNKGHNLKNIKPKAPSAERGGK